MDLSVFLLGFAIVACVYMAANIGANDVANAMGTSVGSKTFTYKQAILVAAFAEFFGAFLVGGHVSDTIRKGMMDPLLFSDAPLHLVYGMISALVAAAIWLNISSYLGWPVSTTHSIVGAVVGFGVIAGGLGAINWLKIGSIVLSWVVSPLMGGIFSFLMFRFISRQIFDKRHPLVRAKAIIPRLFFLVCVILVNAVVYKGLKNLHMDLAFSQALTLSLVVGVIGYGCAGALVKRIKEPGLEDVASQHTATENIFKYLQGITAFYVAFAHGSNDVANAVGPLAAVVSILEKGSVEMKVGMPTWILGLGGACIVFGLFVWGRRVMQTVGKEITEITPSRGFSAEFGAATVVLICSKIGLPISTTHTLVGSVVGVGLARGLATLNLVVIRKIVVSWLATVPFTAVLAMIIYQVFLTFLP